MVLVCDVMQLLKTQFDKSSAAPANAFSVSEVNSRKDFHTLRQVYDGLHQRDPTAGLLLSWDWLDQLFQENPDRICILIVWNGPAGEQLVGALPLMRSLHWSRSRAQFQTRYAAAGRLGLSDYCGIVCNPDHEPKVIRALAYHLKARPWARVSLRFERTVRRSRTLAREFETDGFWVSWPDYRVNKGQTNQLRTPVLALPADYDTYLAGRSRKFRKNLRRSERHRALAKGVVFHVTDASTYERDRNDLLDLWRAKWVRQKSPRKLLPLLERNRALLDRCFRLGILHIISFRDSERPLVLIAHLLDAAEGRVHSLIEGRNSEPESAGLGNLLTQYAIRDAIENKYSFFDLGPGNAAYKYSLGAEDQHTAYLAIDRSKNNTTGVLDPGQIPAALAKSEIFIKRGQSSEAKSALRQLLGLYDQASVSSSSP